MADESPADYESEHSSEEESGSEASEQQSADEEFLPYPFLGRPYVTNSILNTLDLTLVNKALKELHAAPFTCIQLSDRQLQDEVFSVSYFIWISSSSLFKYCWLVGITRGTS